jgi:hypothetical protein
MGGSALPPLPPHALAAPELQIWRKITNKYFCPKAEIAGLQELRLRLPILGNWYVIKIPQIIAALLQNYL